VIERLTDMPDRTLGFRASGEVSREEYRDVLEPAMREAVDGLDAEGEARTWVAG
jgi:hypothetical protein